MTIPLLLYLHIPKTAGSSVSDLIRSHYHQEEIRTVSPPDYLASERALYSADESEKSGLRLVEGHFNFGLHRAFAQQGAYFTILREPVDRLVSLYYFIRSAKSHPRHEIALGMSLEEFACSGVNPEIENCQTKMLSGRPESNFVNGREPCTEEDLERAKRHLREHFLGVGLFESLDLSLLMLSRKMGWPVARAGRKNVTSKRRRVADLSPEELDAVVSVNAFDLQLYNYARTLFHGQLRQLSWWERLRFSGPFWLGQA